MLDPEVKKRALLLAKDMEKEDGVTGAVNAFHKHYSSNKLEAQQPTILRRKSSKFSVKQCFGCSSRSRHHPM